MQPNLGRIYWVMIIAFYKDTSLSPYLFLIIGWELGVSEWDLSGPIRVQVVELMGWVNSIDSIQEPRYAGLHPREARTRAKRDFLSSILLYY